ncbi:MAG: thioredoxin reductase, partial [Actinomycetota bacterium]|nr:thioredoxin reductase [Actinomycetota bacterium]
RGVSYCATCDAAFFKDHETVIVGGGDSAMEEAIFLSKFATKVTIVNRRDEFRASKIMLERARSAGNIEFLTPYVVEEFVAGENGALGKAVLRHVETGETREIEMTGAFIAIGHEPQSEIVVGQVQTDDEGYVITEGRSTRTGKPGVFAAGDLVDHTYRQAVTAAGSGCQAALDAEWYLRDTPQVPTPEGMPEGDLAEAQWAPTQN